MDIETKIELIKRPPTEELITEADLRILLESKEHPVAYNGFEPSGAAHLGTGLITALKVKDFTDAGCKFILFLADWHAWVNRKIGGDLSKIKKCGDYLKHAWISLGVDPLKVDFVFGSDVYDQEYWKKVINIASELTFSRARRSLTIAGRKEKEELPLATYFYAPMQVADIFHLDVDICQLGIDQRRANILSRELGPKLGFWKPVCVHHHLLMSLVKPKAMGFEADEKLDRQISSKMAKSIPEVGGSPATLFIDDSPELIRNKILSAYCPPKDTYNPMMEIVEYIFMRDGKTPFIIYRESKHGGDVTFEHYSDLDMAYHEGKIHPLDLKNSVAEALIEILEPCRRYFETHREARELADFVRKIELTR